MQRSSFLHNRKTNDSCFREKTVSKEFMRKYIHVAKAVTPVLTEEAANHIAEEYSRLRSQDQMGTDIARVGWTQNLINHDIRICLVSNCGEPLRTVQTV